MIGKDTIFLIHASEVALSALMRALEWGMSAQKMISSIASSTALCEIRTKAHTRKSESTVSE